MATTTITVLTSPSTKVDKIRSVSPLRCCQSAASSSSSIDAVVETDQVLVCEPRKTYAIIKNNETFNNNNKYHVDDGQELLREQKFPKRPPVDLEFNNITFDAWSWSMTRFQRDHKQILHGVSGEFRSGELSVIMGPSGAGKSTLLNILAGYTTRGSGGEVRVNGVARDNNNPYRFRKLCAYIPQNEELRSTLTVMEAMTTAAHLKLGYTVTLAYKIKHITNVLEMLGLENHQRTLTGKLSGGQRKRLAIALELLSNPPILFLDEPTTGLDMSSCSQCVSLLKRLAQEGRTIVCTIHQPSALLFNMFDQLYALAEGRCIFQGPVKELLPHLSSVGLQCPPYHNPADFLMEVAIGEYNTDPKHLAKLCSSKFPTKKEKHITSKDSFKNGKIAKIQYYDESSLPPASWIMQLYLLYRRTILSARRNYTPLLYRLLSHIIIACLFGYLYQGVGAAANTILGNYVYMYGSLLLVVYTGKMSVTLNFPLEMAVLQREHFNRWYKLTPYILSVILFEIPFQVLCTWSYIAISYWLTGQPCDFRLYLCVIFFTLSTLCAQSWGYFIGATTPVKIAVFLGPVIACLFSIFGFCIRYFDTPIYFRWLFHISYFRAGFHGIVYSIYGLGRTNLHCPPDHLYCHYIDPSKFLKEMDITDVDLPGNMSLIIVIGCIMHALTFLALWIRLNKR